MSQQNTNGQFPQGAYDVSPNPAPTIRGCFGMAWDDVTRSQGYLGKAMLMALIGMVPVLNFVNAGYAWNWARGVVFGQREQLPSTIVNGENFKIGFFSLVISVIAALVAYVETLVIVWLLGSVGNSRALASIGGLLGIVLVVFIGMFGTLAIGRMAVFGNLGQGFAVGEIMNGYKQRLGSLFCVTFVPALIVGLIAFAIELVIGVLMGAIVGGNLVGMYGVAGRSSANASYAIAQAFSNGGAVIVLLSLIAAYAVLVTVMFANLVSARGIAYYIARFAPTWSNQAHAESQAYQSVSSTQSMSAVSPAAVPQPRFDPHTGQPLGGQGSVLPANPADGGIASGPGRAAGSVASANQDAVWDTAHASSNTSVLQQMPQHSQVRTDVPDYNYDTVVGLQHETAAPLWTPPGGGPSSRANAAKPNDADTMVLGHDPAEKNTPTLRITRSNGQSCKLTSFPVTIGKGSEADLVIEDNPAVSRLHVRLLNEGDTFAVEDLGATNKSKLGSYELPPHVPTILSNGDELKLANEVLRIEIR